MSKRARSTMPLIPFFLALAWFLGLGSATRGAGGQGTPLGPVREVPIGACEDEPRTPITSLPATIVAPGSYFLARNLVGTAGASGITVDADDVTIDLRGFRLSGVPGSLDGVTSTRERVVVRGGNVVDWGGTGVHLGGFGCVVEDVCAAGNGGHGILVEAGIVRACIAYGCQLDGVRMAASGLVEGCYVAQNGGSGVSTGGSSGGIVRDCVASENTLDGITQTAGGGWLVAANSAGVNGQDGIELCGSSLALHNVCSSNTVTTAGAGILMRCGKNFAAENYLVGNDVGVLAVGVVGNVVSRNTAVNNPTAYSAPPGNDFGSPIVASGTVPWANLSD